VYARTAAPLELLKKEFGNKDVTYPAINPTKNLKLYENKLLIPNFFIIALSTIKE
jgi:hypothetical protein